MASKKKKRKQRKPAFRTSNPERETRFARLRALDCFEQIKPRIMEGHSMPKVAEWIQDELGEMEDCSREGLVTMLRRYRETFPDSELIKDRMPDVFEEAKTRVHESLDELAELEDLYRIQKERLMIDVKLERTFNKLLPSNTQEIRAAREILSTIAELKMDLGLHDRKLGTVDVDAKIEATLVARYGDTKLGKTLANPQQRQRLLGLAKQLAKKASAPVIDVEGEESPVATEGSSEEKASEAVESEAEIPTKSQPVPTFEEGISA